MSHIGGFVDLNLNQTGVGGGCSLTTPDGQEHTLGATTSIPGVTIRPNSKFVSCRVTIGPMTEALLGDWVLTLLGSDQTRRTQPMTIAWASEYFFLCCRENVHLFSDSHFNIVTFFFNIDILI